MVILGCAKPKSISDHSKFWADFKDVDTIQIKGYNLTDDRFMSNNYQWSKDGSCWNSKHHFYVLMTNKSDIDTLKNAFSKAKHIKPDYDTKEYDYIVRLSSGGRKGYIYVSSAGRFYIDDNRIYSSYQIHDMIILALGPNAYSADMGVPEEWLYEMVKKKYPSFPQVAPDVWK